MEPECRLATKGWDRGQVGENSKQIDEKKLKRKLGVNNGGGVGETEKFWVIFSAYNTFLPQYLLLEILQLNPWGELPSKEAH